MILIAITICICIYIRFKVPTDTWAFTHQGHEIEILSFFKEKIYINGKRCSDISTEKSKKQIKHSVLLNDNDSVQIVINPVNSTVFRCQAFHNEEQIFDSHSLDQPRSSSILHIILPIFLVFLSSFPLPLFQLSERIQGQTPSNHGPYFTYPDSPPLNFDWIDFTIDRTLFWFPLCMCFFASVIITYSKKRRYNFVILSSLFFIFAHLLALVSLYD